jgi:hypothetical protein
MGQVELSTDRTLIDTNSEDGVTYGYPRLICRVMSFDWGGNEYSKVGGFPWTLVLEETTAADFAS